MEIIVGNERYPYWRIGEGKVSIYSTTNYLRKAKIKESFAIQSIKKVELYYKSEFMACPGAMMGAGLNVAYPMYITFYSTGGKYTVDANSSHERRPLLEALEYLQDNKIVLVDKDNLLEGLKREDVVMWEYIDEIEKRKESKNE